MNSFRQYRYKSTQYEHQISSPLRETQGILVWRQSHFIETKLASKFKRVERLVLNRDTISLFHLTTPSFTATKLGQCFHCSFVLLAQHMPSCADQMVHRVIGNGMPKISEPWKSQLCYETVKLSLCVVSPTCPGGIEYRVERHSILVHLISFTIKTCCQCGCWISTVQWVDR